MLENQYAAPTNRCDLTAVRGRGKPSSNYRFSPPSPYLLSYSLFPSPSHSLPFYLTLSLPFYLTLSSTSLFPTPLLLSPLHLSSPHHLSLPLLSLNDFFVLPLPISGHPKLRLFVTHGGMNGLMEAVYHGVPVLGIPLFGDQIENMVRVKAKQMGTFILPDQLKADNFASTIRHIIENKW